MNTVIFLQDSITDESGFQLLVLNVLSLNIVPDFSDSEETLEFILHSIQQISRVLMTDNEWQADLSPKQAFCWNVLGTCCSKISISNENFDWLHQNFSVTDELCILFGHYRRTLGLVGDDLPVEMDTHKSTDMQRYLIM